MEKELFSLFPSFELFTDCPAKPAKESFVFEDPAKGSWFRIDKKDVNNREYALLTALFTEIKSEIPVHSFSQKWLRYLENGENPPVTDLTEIRVIQLAFNKQQIEEENLKEASCAFFGNTVQLVFASPYEAYLIEPKTCTVLDTENFSSYMSVLESDFYIKAKMYIGKFQPVDSRFPFHFATEKEWFQKALSTGSAERVYTMEKLFPIYLIEQMPEALKKTLIKEVLDPLDYDPEILDTVKAFFENGFNASVASKKLYIHRNTLQYRLNKFQEITGIPLRDFNGALVSYCASLMARANQT